MVPSLQKKVKNKDLQSPLITKEIEKSSKHEHCLNKKFLKKEIKEINLKVTTSKKLLFVIK